MSLLNEKKTYDKMLYIMLTHSINCNDCASKTRNNHISITFQDIAALYPGKISPLMSMVCAFVSCKPIKGNRVVPRIHLVPSDYGTPNMLSYSLAAALLLYMQKTIIIRKAFNWQARSFFFEEERKRSTS